MSKISAPLSRMPLLHRLVAWTEEPWHQKAFVGGLYLSYALFAIALTGIVKLDGSYLNTLESVLRYYVCFFLILRFNPWASHKRGRDAATVEFDRRVSLSAGVFLLLTTTLTKVASAQLSRAKATASQGGAALLGHALRGVASV